MKRLSGYMMLLLVILVTNCSKKSDPAPANLTGSWKETSAVFSSCDNPSDNRTETCSTNCPVWEFKSDGTLAIQGNNAGTYVVSGNNVTLTVLGLPNTTLPFTVSGSTLTISGFSDSQGSNGTGGVDMCSLALVFTKQ